MMGIRAAFAAKRDEGAALIVVIGTMMIFAIVSVTIVSSAMFASATSSTARAAVQVQNVAEEAIDQTINVLSTLERGQESSFPASLPWTMTTQTVTVDAPVEILYSWEGGSGYGHPAPSGVELTGALLTARATGTILTGDGQREITRVVQQELSVVEDGVVSPLLGYGVFSAGDLETTNNFEVIDGGAHTNGMFRCNSASQILGPVTAVGGASITNNCVMEGLWVGGNLSCSSGPLIDGDLVVVGTASFTNTCTVTGHSIIGAHVSAPGLAPRSGYAYNFGGDLISATGGFSYVQPSARIAGNLQIANSDTNVTAAQVGGSITLNSPSAVPSGPPAQEMPPIRWSDLTTSEAPTPSPFREWIQQNAQNNGAPSYSPAYQGTTCEVARPNWSLNGPLHGPPAPATLDARDCNVSLNGGDGQPLELFLSHDLTIVANAFSSSNGIRVRSTAPGGDQVKLRLIVPLPEGADSCSGAGNGGISFDSGGVVFEDSVDVLFYTNGQVRLTNGVELHGSVYGCTTNFSVNSTIVYADMTPPGMGNPGGPYYIFIPTARYDLNAGD